MVCEYGRGCSSCEYNKVSLFSSSQCVQVIKLTFIYRTQAHSTLIQTLGFAPPQPFALLLPLPPVSKSRTVNIANINARPPVMLHSLLEPPRAAHTSAPQLMCDLSLPLLFLPHLQDVHLSQSSGNKLFDQFFFTGGLECDYGSRGCGVCDYSSVSPSFPSPFSLRKSPG